MAARFHESAGFPPFRAGGQFKPTVAGALIITAENDVLRDECEAYGCKLIEAGVETVIARYNGTIPAPDKFSCGSELLESLLEEYRRGKHEVNRCTGPPVISETVLTLWGRTPELASST